MKPIPLFNRAVLIIEGAVTALLVVLAALGVVDFVIKMFEVATADGFVTPEGTAALAVSALTFSVGIVWFSPRPAGVCSCETTDAD